MFTVRNRDLLLKKVNSFNLDTNHYTVCEPNIYCIDSQADLQHSETSLLHFVALHIIICCLEKNEHNNKRCEADGLVF